VEPIPERIGAYRVLRRLIAPGPAETFLGRVEGPRGFARECVLKRMKNTVEGHERLAEELTREAAICARINHPAILRMVDFFEDGGHLVLALEHLDGTSLDQLLEHLVERRQKLGDAAAFYIGHRVAGALAHAHAATDESGAATPIIHRNLHPSNVMIGVDGDVRLTGFGVGKILGRTPDTAIGTIKGTPGYMAPEQMRGEPVTAKADTYGLGLLLWSLLTGRKPPSDGTWPAKIGTLRKDLPREISALIDASLDRFPGTRRITCGEIERWLGKIASDDDGRRELKEQMLSLPTELEPGIEDSATGPLPDAVTAPLGARKAAPGAASPFQGVRFGPPAAPTQVAINEAPAAPAKSGGDWRQSLPDVDNLDALIDSVRAPDRGRASEPTAARPRAFPPAPPLPTALAAAPKIPPAPALTPAPAPVAAAAAMPVIPPPPPPPAPPAVKAKAGIIAPKITAPVPPPPTPPLEMAAPAAPAFGPPPPPVANPAFPVFGTPPQAATPAPPVFGPPPPVATPSSPVFGTPPQAATPAPPVFGPPPQAPPQAATPAPPVFGSPPVFSPAPPQVGSGAPRVLSSPEIFAPPPRARPPSPSLLAISRRTLGTAGTIAVSALTATVVVVVAFLLREHPAPPGAAASAEAVTIDAAPAPPAPAPSPSPSIATTAVAPTATATATATAAPATPSLSSLPSGFGYLTVVSTSSAHVYLSGKHLGPVNEPLQVRCGRWFVRLATPREGRYPEWVSRGETINVDCQAATRIEIAPDAPRRK
jgi:eukaryotic-like serine/threonine-protein kinase